MKVDVASFKESLSLLKSVYQYNNNIDIADFVLMTDNLLICTNDNIRITVPFNNDLNFIFAAKEMLLFLSKIKNNTLEIQNDGNITCGNIKSKFEEIKSFKRRIKRFDTDTIDYKSIPSNFKDGLLFCLNTTFDEMSNYAHADVNIRIDSVDTTDNFRISQYKLQDSFEIAYSIPRKAAKELVKFDLVSYGYNNEYISFKDNNDVTIYIKKQGVTPPEYISYLFNDEGTKIAFPETFSNSIETGMIFTEGYNKLDKKVNVNIENSILTVGSECTTGHIIIEEQIQTKEKITFGVNYLFLKTALKYYNETIINEEFNTALFMNKDSRHIMNLMGQ